MLSSLPSESLEEFDSSDRGVKNAPTWRSILFRILFSYCHICPFTGRIYDWSGGRMGSYNSFSQFTSSPMWKVMSRAPWDLLFNMCCFYMWHITHLTCHVKCSCSCTRILSVMCNYWYVEPNWEMRCEVAKWHHVKNVYYVPSGQSAHVFIHCMMCQAQACRQMEFLCCLLSVFHLHFMVWMCSAGLTCET